MKKNIILLSFLINISFIQAQVGINNSSPKTTLDIQGVPSDPNTRDGVIAPQLTGNQLKSKNDLYQQEHKGTIVYITSADTNPQDKTINVTKEGYYYFDGSAWQSFTSSTTTEPWIETNTTNKQATAASGNVYRNHKVGIGDFSTSDASAYIDIKTGGTVENKGYGIKLQDGNQRYGRFLTSDAEGNGTWQDFVVYKIIGSTGTGINIPFTDYGTTPSIPMGNNITLPPGPWEVEASLLLDSGGSGSNSYCWLRFSFTDTLNGTTPTKDLVSNNTKISGSHNTITFNTYTGGTDTLSFYSIINGKVIINNTSGADKTYYLFFETGLCKGPARQFVKVGDGTSYKENYISALRATLDYNK